MAGKPGHTLTELPVSADRGDSLPAFVQYVEQLTPTPTLLRILFAPPGLEFKPTACCKGSRETTHQHLLASGKTAALANASVSWAIHKVYQPPGGGQPWTILYLEQSELLAQLRALLPKIQIEGAFPLATAVDAYLDDKPQAAIALLNSDQGTYVYWQTATGDRQIRVLEGAPDVSQITHAVAEASGTIPPASNPLFLVLDLATTALALDTVGEKLTPTKITLDQLFDASLKIQPRSPLNFLPPPVRVPASLVAYGAAAALLIVAGALGLRYRNTVVASQADLTQQSFALQRLEAENRLLGLNRTHILLVESVLTETALPARHRLDFLKALNRSRPTTISIRSVNLKETSWIVNGYIHEGLDEPNGPYPLFLKNLSASDHWLINPSAIDSVQKSPDFTLNGTFK